MRRDAAVLTLITLLAACGGGGGSSPSAPAPASTPVPVVAPTAPPPFGVVHGLSSQHLTPDSVTPDPPLAGQSVTVALEGYLTREQPWDGTPIALWPCRSKYETDIFSDLVYGLDLRPLIKWTTMDVEATLSVIEDGWEEEIPEIRDAFERSFAEFTAAGGPTFSWTASGGPPGLEVPVGPGLRVIVDRNSECFEDEYVACAQWWRDGSSITRAELTFDSPETVRDRRVRMYMLGYAVGLSGTDAREAVMNREYFYRGDRFHELENTALWMMYTHRRPGNLLPDRDPAFASASDAGGLGWAGDRGPGRRR